MNGELLQDGNTKDMLFDVWQQIETLSIVCTLEPGDLIATGTPAGIGITRKPMVLLKPGDTVPHRDRRHRRDREPGGRRTRLRP